MHRLLIILSFCWCFPSFGELERVPYTSFVTPERTFDCYVDTKELRSYLRSGASTLELSSGYLPLQIEQVSAGHLVASRRFFEEGIKVQFFGNAGEITELNLPEDTRGSWFRRMIVGDGLIALVVLSPVDGHQVTWLSSGPSGWEVAGSTALASIGGDYNLQGVYAKGNFWLGAENMLYKLPPQGTPERINVGFNVDWIELTVVHDQPFGLATAGRPFVQAFEDAKMPVFRMFNLDTKKAVATSDFPFELTTQGTNLAFSSLRSAEQLEEIFLRDFSHSENSGMLFLGAGNSEGRIAWAAVYYLEGLIDFLRTRESQTAFEWKFSAATRAELRKRLDLEIKLIDRLLASDQPGLIARRYSANREPLLFAAHTGRVLRLLKRYAHEMPNPLPLQNLANLEALVLNLTGGHREELFLSDGSMPGIQPGVRLLRTKRGQPVDFDGVNIPFNQQNAWASGIAYGRDDPATKAIVRDFASTLLKEGPITSPLLLQWRYWWGTARSGWTNDNVSINTPSYAGTVGNANINYRTMDIGFLLEAYKLVPEAFTNDLPADVRRLIEQGGIHPFATESLSDFGIVPNISSYQALFNLRPTGSFELQNSIWAIWALQNDGWLRNPVLHLEGWRQGDTLFITIQSRPTFEYSLVKTESITPVSSLKGDGSVLVFEVPLTASTLSLYRVLETPGK